MDITTRINSFVSLGQVLRSMPAEQLKTLADKTANQNPWFTHENIKFALKEISQSLTAENLTDWISQYSFNATKPKTIAIIAAGNIPLVGFHDVMSILIAGHVALVKLSSKDTILLPYMAEELFSINPAFKSLITFSEERISGFDAVIATGSDNTSRYFNYYFDKYPHIIRKNRSSCAILTGFENKFELAELRKDVFSYFGLGCRNVSKIYIPKGYDLTTLLDAWGDEHTIIHHHKYANNYNYQKSILLVNKVPFLDNGYVLLKESPQIVSPIAVLHYEEYESDSALQANIQGNQAKIQCIVGNHQLATVGFGTAQSPQLGDYADQIDTLAFIQNL